MCEKGDRINFNILPQRLNLWLNITGLAENMSENGL